jgi:protein-disulfide isomerase
VKFPYITLVLSLMLASGLVIAAEAPATPATPPAPVISKIDPAKTETVIKYAVPLFHNDSDPIGGNPDGKITIAEFFDYMCSHCIVLDPTIIAIAKTNQDVKVVYKEFPIRGAVSTYATKAALAANLQGKYFELHEALIHVGEALTQDKVLELAKSVGLDMEKLKTDMNSDAIQNAIKTNYKLAQDMGINGTPAVVGGPTDMAQDKKGAFYILGETDYVYLQSLINKMKV